VPKDWILVPGEYLTVEQCVQAHKFQYSNTDSPTDRQIKKHGWKAVMDASPDAVRRVATESFNQLSKLEQQNWHARKTQVMQATLCLKAAQYPEIREKLLGYYSKNMYLVEGSLSDYEWGIWGLNPLTKKYEWGENLLGRCWGSLAANLLEKRRTQTPFNVPTDDIQAGPPNPALVPSLPQNQQTSPLPKKIFKVENKKKNVSDEVSYVAACVFNSKAEAQQFISSNKLNKKISKGNTVYFPETQYAEIRKNYVDSNIFLSFSDLPFFTPSSSNDDIGGNGSSLLLAGTGSDVLQPSNPSFLESQYNKVLSAFNKDKIPFLAGDLCSKALAFINQIEDLKKDLDAKVSKNANPDTYTSEQRKELSDLVDALEAMNDFIQFENPPQTGNTTNNGSSSSLSTHPDSTSTTSASSSIAGTVVDQSKKQLSPQLDQGEDSAWLKNLRQVRAPGPFLTQRLTACANRMRFKSSIGWRILGGLMIGIGVIVVALGGAAVAAAFGAAVPTCGLSVPTLGGLGAAAIAGGLGLITCGSVLLKRTSLMQKMKDVRDELNNYDYI
jgi:predicted NAD-dependent protein-ADP-ribosyltransferase YbiA (DUF1768 family)